MMKSFFKKLAFVMALAMVVSMVAPAATTASAAEEKKPLAIAYQKGAAITALNLVEVGDTEDLRFVYAPENWKELNPTWTSSNPNVVSVDQNGVVKAEAAGTATVSVAVGSETASIEVYSVDTTTFVATMGNAENKAMTELTLTVGEDFDFAFYGIKDYSVDKYNCTWLAVDPEGVLDFDDTNGKLVAKKAGVAKITLLVANVFTGIKTDVQACTVTVKNVEPEVDPNNFEITKLISDSKFELTFENKAVTVEDLQKNLSVYYYVGNQRIQYNYPKTVEVKDGVVTVTFHQLVWDGTTYGFKYNGLEKEYTVRIGEPASMYLTWQDQGGTYNWNVAYAGYNTKLFPHILNAEGTEITTTILNDAQGRYVEYKLADTSVAAQFYMQGNNMIYFTAADQTALVVATFYNGFDSLGQRVESVSTVPTAITSTVRPQRTFTFQTPYGVSVNGYRHAWGDYFDGVTKLAVGDADKYFAVGLKDNYNNKEKIENLHMEYDSEAGLGIYDLGGLVARYYGQFSFASDNISVFTIDANTGHIVANRAGQANVLVYYDPDMYNTTSADKILVAVVPVTTFDRRVPTTFTVDSNYKTVSTYAGDDGDNYNQVTFKLTIKDQLGDPYNVNVADLRIDRKSVAASNATFPVTPTVFEVFKTDGTRVNGVYGATFTFTNANVERAGLSRALYYAFTYKYAEKATFTANVVRPDLTLQAGAYGFEAWADKADINAFATNNGADHSILANLYVYKNGVKVDREPVSLMTADLWKYPADANFDTVYVKVLKNGVDVTEKKIGDAQQYAVNALDNNVTITTSKTGILSAANYATNGCYFNTVDNTLGAGTYTILAYKAVSTSNSASPRAMQLVASSTVTVNDTKVGVSYAGKVADTVLKSDYIAGTTPTQVELNAIAKACFAVKVGDHTCKAQYGNWKKVEVKANAIQYNANTIYFESLEIYVPVGGINSNSTEYVKYVVPVGDYVITH